MNILLLVIIFALAVLIGRAIDSPFKQPVKCKVYDLELIITYKHRTLYITGSRELRLPSYKRKGDFEFITIPIGRGEEGLRQVERFMQRHGTTILVKRLFEFSKKRDPNGLYLYDPLHAKELVEIQYKLYCFCKTT